MMKQLAKNIRLQFSISVIFLMLITPLFVGFIAYSYQTNSVTYKNNAVNLVARGNQEFINSLVALLNPIASSVRVTSRLISAQPELANQDRIAEHLLVNLENNPNIVSYFLATKEGSFRQVQRTNKALPVGDRIPPDGSHYVSWVIDRSKKPEAESVYTFFKASGGVVEKFATPTKYDPRTRGFYTDTVKAFSSRGADAMVIDNPFFAASTKQAVIGTTIPFVADKELLGTVTAQVAVRSFSEFLSANLISRNSQTLIIDTSGNIIVHPDVDKGFIRDRDNLTPRKVLDLQNSPAAMAQQLRAESKKNQIEFQFGPQKETYFAIFQPFPSSFSKPWEVMTVVPLNDFLQDLNTINQRLMMFGALAFVFIALVSVYLSKIISKPLERLTAEIQGILDFTASESALIKSSIYEVNTLSKAIRKLKTTIAAFTSYVPRDLVNDLMSSGNALELGGESRYLTILFSDLKDFSSLSESTPSRELLRRVSSYLELMTYAIKEEVGTVDKFIGDAVMAFWGAPKLDQDHAYHACVAAVKAQRRMVTLNQQLRSENKPPLEVRIGLHTDAVIVGNIGSPERLSYTVMGDGVNIASRLEGINKEFGTHICVSHSLFREAGERLWLRPIDQITVKGRKGELIIYELLGIRDGTPETQPNEAERALCESTQTAYDLYASHDYKAALAAYEAIAQQCGDALARVMVDRCRQKLAH